MSERSQEYQKVPKETEVANRILFRLAFSRGCSDLQVTRRGRPDPLQFTTPPISNASGRPTKSIVDRSINPIKCIQRQVRQNHAMKARASQETSKVA